MELIWLPAAEKKLDEIYCFYEERSFTAAHNIITDIRHAAERLKSQPQMAAREPLLVGFTKTYRSLPVRKHFKIVYFVDEEKGAIVIAIVWDSRQNPERLKFEIASPTSV